MPTLTSVQIDQINNIKNKALTAAAKIGAGNLATLLDRRNSNSTRSPHVRFVIETQSAANLAVVRRVVARVLQGTDLIAPGVSWQNRRLIVPNAGAAAVNVNAAFDVRFMFPGTDPRDQRFKLANFIVLTLPIDPLSAKRQLGGGTGSLHDLAYAIRDAGSFVRVDPEIPSKGWRRVNVPSAVLPQPPGVPVPETPAQKHPPLVRPILFLSPVAIRRQNLSIMLGISERSICPLPPLF